MLLEFFIIYQSSIQELRLYYYLPSFIHALIHFEYISS